jgi:hypothetical protein
MAEKVPMAIYLVHLPWALRRYEPNISRYRAFAAERLLICIAFPVKP